jgi:hypothetical protein
LEAKSITATERAKRVRIYEEALASLRLEGLSLDPTTEALYQRYIEGELSLFEVGKAIDALNAQGFEL